MDEDKSAFDQRRKLIEERASYCIMPGVFITVVFIIKIYSGSFTFLFLFIPFALYILWKMWKSGELWGYPDFEEIFFFIHLCICVYATIAALRNDPGIMFIIFCVIVYGAAFIALISEYIKEIRSVK